MEKKYAERNRERGDSRPQRSDSQLSTPGTRKPKLFSSPNPDAFGRMTEGFARYMGTPQFLMWMTIFCGVWLAWNSLAPEEMQFDPRSLNFTLLTLMLSLQASYAAPCYCWRRTVRMTATAWWPLRTVSVTSRTWRRPST